MPEPLVDPIDVDATRAFAELARSYCAWAENAAREGEAEEVVTALDLLLRLTRAALTLRAVGAIYTLQAWWADRTFQRGRGGQTGMRRLITVAVVFATACVTVPGPPPYDEACFGKPLPDGVAYPAPIDALNRLFGRPELDPGSQSGTMRIVTLRRAGPYSEPEAQVSLFEEADGSVRAELLQPVGCSVSDQLYSAFVKAPASSEDERFRAVKIERIEVTDRDMPQLRRFRDQFRRLRLSADLYEGLLLDAVQYQLWIDTPMNSLALSTAMPDPPLDAWAARLIAALSARRRN